MRKINNVTRPVARADLRVGELVEFGSCTSAWRIQAIEGQWLVLVQVRGAQIGQMTHTESPVQRVGA